MSISNINPIAVEITERIPVKLPDPHYKNEMSLKDIEYLVIS